MITPPTKAQVDFIRENAELLTDLQIAAILTRLGSEYFNERRVKKIRVKLGLKKEEAAGRSDKRYRLRRPKK